MTHSPTPFVVYDPSPKNMSYAIHDADGISIGEFFKREDAIFVANATANHEFYQERIRQLEGALRFYEEHARNCRKLTPEGQNARSWLDADSGEKARRALEAKP